MRARKLEKLRYEKTTKNEIEIMLPGEGQFYGEFD